MIQAQTEKIGRLTLSIKEVAETLGLAPITIRRMIASGRLPAARTQGRTGQWLISRGALERLLSDGDLSANRVGSPGTELEFAL